MFEPIKSEKNYSIIVTQIQQMILSGELQKGDKLPSERALCELLKVSRASVREALKALEIMGVLESRQGDGTFITDYPDSTISDSLCLMFALSNGSLDDMLQLRRIIELEACKNIIHKATDEQIASLNQLITAYENTTSAVEHSSFDTEFHRALIDLSGNLLFKCIFQTLQSFLSPYISGMTQMAEDTQQKDITISQHQAIITALQSRDLKAVEQALSQHITIDEVQKEQLTHYTKLTLH